MPNIELRGYDEFYDNKKLEMLAICDRIRDAFADAPYRESVRTTRMLTAVRDLNHRAEQHLTVWLSDDTAHLADDIAKRLAPLEMDIEVRIGGKFYPAQKKAEAA